MTTRSALYLAGILLALGLGDLLLTGGESLLFLAKKFTTLRETLEFWR